MAQFKLRQAKKSDPNQLAPKAHFEKADNDFIPYCGYYDKKTLITKNGELMKVIRVTGFTHESISSELVNLRETLRDSITNIKSDNFALWITTIRRKKEIIAEGEFDDFFSKTLDNVWTKTNKWDEQYVNELYVSVIIEGYNTSISNLNSLVRSFSFSSTKKLHHKKLEESHKKLSRTVDKIMSSLSVYGAKVIGVNEFKGDTYSQLMRFFGKVVNLSEDRYPLTPTDMSQELIENYDIVFGNNSLAVCDNKGKKHYGAMFSIKEYQEVAISALDKFMQLPQEFVITQSVDFISRNEALMELDYQNYILDVSHDDHMKELSGLDSIIASDSGSLTDFGKQQITLMLINDSAEKLSYDIENTLESLHDLGLVTVREDVFSELCFWSQLPANFTFLRRQKPINIKRIGGFASLHNFPAGNKDGNHWGCAVTIFRTVMGTPYFFNFHEADNGHTMIIGPDNSGKTTLLNFLVAQARKFRSKIYYFGTNRSGKIFINAMGGNYISLNKNLDDAGSLVMSPFSLEDTDENNKFLADWLFYLVNYGKEKIDQKELDLIPKVIAKIRSKNIKKLSQGVELFKTKATQNIYKKLSPWHSKGKYAFVFDNENGINFSEDLINAIDLTSILDKKSILVPVITYILYKIENNLDGTPAIIVLDEAWELLDNYALGPKLNDLLERLRKKNCIIIFATKSATDAALSNIKKSLDGQIATEIFLPDPNPTDYYKSVFGLNEEEFELLTRMNLQDRHFFLKHADNTIIATLDLMNAYHITAVLSANKDSLNAMDEIKNKYGQDAKKWVPKFLDLIESLEEEEEDEY